VIYEFENRRKTRIFSHTPGAITLEPNDLQSSRNRVIEENLSNSKFHSVFNTHIEASILDEDNTVLCHGSRRSDGFENCSVIGADCQEGESNAKCNPGKCALGKLVRVEGRSLWKYESLTVPALFYYVKGTTSVQLKHISRGRFILPASSGEVNVDRLASIATTIYLPPSLYSEETFVRRTIAYYNEDGKISSLQDSCDNFIRSVLNTEIGSYPVDSFIVNRLIQSFSQLPEQWELILSQAVQTLATNNPSLSRRDFLVQSYSLLSTYFDKFVQESKSSIRTSSLNFNTDIARPVYSRLPGLSGAYNSEDNPDNPSKWLVSGIDETLSHSKTLLDRFYSLYLDPDTAYPVFLDWIAQHMGFTSGMWDLDWSNQIKRILLKNAHRNNIPENDSLWTQDPDEDNFSKIDRSRIEAVMVNGMTGEVQTSYRFMEKQYDTNTELTSLVPTNSITIDSSNWPGLIPGRGSMISLLFLFYVFGIRGVSGEELRYNSADQTFSVKSGLRQSEQFAPINIPYGVDVLHVGTPSDSENGVYPNQLIADIGVCQDEESSNTMVIRMPFYYNRDGRTWDTVISLVENWVPATVQAKVQYGYAAADLLVADDIFFEPEID
jgi:hypothetical protein